MSEIAKKPNQTPESYSPRKPEIVNMMKEAVKNERNFILPSECIIRPKDKIAPFSGDRWPYSNVEPAVYGALGLYYGRTENSYDDGALINSDIEYSIHNVLTGHAFGLFYCRPDDFLSMAAYGFSSFRLKTGDYSEKEIITIIKDQIYRGNAVHIDEGNGPFDYLIWGYKDDGNVLLGYKFEHGNDMVNCSYDFETPSEFDSLTKGFSDVTLYKPNGEKPGGLTFIRPDGVRLDREIIYRQALCEGYRMLTQAEPPPAMDFSRVHFGYGQAIYDEWIRQLEQANVENSEAFYFSSPIFPHFIALYENRLQLYKFLKIYAEMCGDENLTKAAGLCGELKDMAREGAQIGFENKWSDPKILAMTNNERRILLIELLKKCRALELKIAATIKIFLDAPESYSPKKPEIASMIKDMNENISGNEILVEKISDFCSIVDRTEIHIIGIGVPVSFESQGYPTEFSFSSGTMNDYFIAKKYIADGTILFLAKTLGVNLGKTEIISIRHDIHSDGNYHVIVGFPFDNSDNLPEFLPEHTVTFTLPACRYAKMEINEQKREGRVGYSERMEADAYFIGGFRKDAEYVYNVAGYPMNTWDETGDILTKYEPVRKPVDEKDRFDTFEFMPVLLPPWKIACRTRPHGEDEVRCIFDYFDVATEVFKTGLARYDQNGDFYGFPVDWEGSYKSCFGSRVSSFDGLPENVEKITLSGGLYVHVTQKEFNGDNPSMPYDVAFNHMDTLYFSDHPEYEFDHSRKVIARFRQANCASVIVPVRQK